MFKSLSLIACAFALAACSPKESGSNASSGEVPPATTTPERPQSPSTMPASDSELPWIDSTPYAGPEVQLDVLQQESHPPTCVAQIAITAPTGGWKLSLDQAKVVGDTAKIFLTLEKPGADEFVTQALVVHRERFASADPCFSHAEVYVHLAQRGVSTLTTNYRRAASR